MTRVLSLLGLSSPWALVAVLALGAGLYVKGRLDGVAEERAEVAARAQRAADRAQRARDRVDACLDAGGRWLQSVGRCHLPGDYGAN